MRVRIRMVGAIVMFTLTASLVSCAGSLGPAADANGSGTEIAATPPSDLEAAAPEIWEHCGGSIVMEKSADAYRATRAAAIQSDLETYTELLRAGKEVGTFARTDWYVDLLSAALRSLPAAEKGLAATGGVRLNAVDDDGRTLGLVEVDPSADGRFAITALTFVRGDPAECTITY